MDLVEHRQLDVVAREKFRAHENQYHPTYRMCDATDPANCDSATVAINLSGRSP